MNYYTGERIKLGDYVELSFDIFGVVVAIIEDSKYSELYPKEKWEYLERGILVLSDQIGLMYYADITQEITFLNRQQENG